MIAIVALRTYATVRPFEFKWDDVLVGVYTRRHPPITISKI